MLNQLRTTLSRLGRAHPATYALCYVGLIVAWAWFYYLLRFQFFAPYSHREPAVIGAASELASEMTALILRPFLDGTTKLHDGSFVDFRWVERSLLIEPPESDEDTFNVSFGILQIFPDYPGQPGYFEEVTLHVHVYGHTDSQNQTELIGRVEIAPFEESDAIDGPHRDQILNDREEISALLSHRLMDKADWKRLLEWGAYFKGSPWEIQGSFWRMLYLSAITATTVGYGDIVPMTSRARALTAAEAILGIVLIGLFVGSLANMAPSPSVQPASRTRNYLCPKRTRLHRSGRRGQK